jgi:hypothetical protein
MELTTTNRGFAPATLTEAIQFSDMLASSSMVPKAYQGKPQDILVCVQWGYEMGLAPMQALQNIAVINGKPSVYGDAMMALVQASAVCEDVEEFFENEGTPNPVAVCIAKRKNRKPVVAKFSVEDAKRAGLWAKQGPWSAYPKRMMQMRARGFALRDAFPDVLKGLITAEEAQDYPDDINHGKSAKQARDITPRNPLDAIAPPAPTPVAIPQHTSDPVVIEQAFAQDAEAEELAIKQAEPVEEAVVVDEHVEMTMPDRVPGEDDEPAGSPDEPELPAAVGYALRVPGREQPFSVHDTIEQWADAYEDLADKTARAGKKPPRERMTVLRELKECNEDIIKRIDLVKRIRHTAAYSKRLAALGAAQ